MPTRSPNIPLRTVCWYVCILKSAYQCLTCRNNKRTRISINLFICSYSLNSLMKKLLLLISMLFGGFALAEEPKNEPKCGPTKESLAQLYTHFGEKPVWVGKADNGQLYGIVANQEEKTWSLIIFNDKIACLILTGTGSEILQKVKSGLKIRTAHSD